MATHSSILAWKSPRTEEPGVVQSRSVQTVGHDLATELQCLFIPRGFPPSFPLTFQCISGFLIRNLNSDLLGLSPFQSLSSVIQMFKPPVNLWWHFPQGVPCGSAGKESTCNVGDLGSIPGLGRSPGEGKGYPLQYSGLENSNGLFGPWGHKSRTWLSDLHFHFPSISIQGSRFKIWVAICSASFSPKPPC